MMAFNSRGQVVRTYGRHKQRTIAAWISPEASTKAQHIFSSPEDVSLASATGRGLGSHSLTNSDDKSSSRHSDEDWFPGKRTENKTKTALKESNVKTSQAIKKKPAPRKATTRRQPVNEKENLVEKPVETVEELPPTAKGKRVTRLSRRKKVTADVRSSSHEDSVAPTAKPGRCKGKNALARFDLIHSPIERSWSSSSKRGRRESSDITFDASCDLFDYSADVSETGSRCTTDKTANGHLPKASHLDDSVFGSPGVFLPSRQKACNHSHIDTSTPNDFRRTARSSRQNTGVMGTHPINPDTPVEKNSSVSISRDPHRASCRCPACESRRMNTPSLTDITNEISVLDLNNTDKADDKPEGCYDSDGILQKSITRAVTCSSCSVVVTPLSGDDLSRYSSSAVMSCRKEASVASSCKEQGDKDKENRRIQLLNKDILATPNCSKSLLLSDSYCPSFKEALTPVKSKTTGRLIPARQKVLQQCDQTSPISFTHAIPPDMMEGCVKIGEGVYGEVFRTVNTEGQTVVLKIIPIEGDSQVNGEPQKSFEEILPEIVISRELSALRDASTSTTGGFITVNGVSYCRGCYPEKLLDQWNEYNNRKESENDRPDFFPEDQLFIMFEFADGGMDLESKKLESVHQAVSIFQQVALSLAVAEQSLEFEHRDLHWGNVLVIPTSNKSVSFWLEGEEIKVVSHGVLAGMIDFTLSRLEKDGCTVFCDLSSDETLFTGRGDPQFDVYRKMKDENNNNWEPWNPHTNVLWLHYLLDKLLNAKTYPGYRRDSTQSSLRRELRSLVRHLLSHVSAVEVVRESGLMEL
ncbi:uncharacterized protein LOC119739891 isoform X2 [Patiria miniata]|uniref:non-specific serine/threonine protein kinase n=1 Tax=Patiria miniata TaxID=46514 RepID=A0A914B4S8_PATMI|nr:uncharacterized protein LOC119739891 isoform X2 [Patiria miniata]